MSQCPAKENEDSEVKHFLRNVEIMQSMVDKGPKSGPKRCIDVRLMYFNSFNYELKVAIVTSCEIN